MKSDGMVNYRNGTYRVRGAWSKRPRVFRCYTMKPTAPNRRGRAVQRKISSFGRIGAAVVVKFQNQVRREQDALSPSGVAC